MILVIDNYDSFTFNLVQEIGQLGHELRVARNDQITIEEIRSLQPSHIVISPGPGRPEKAGICIEVLKQFRDSVPILGVCLGHQALGVAAGAHVVLAPRLMHGKSSLIHHDGTGVFRSIPNPFPAGRYHSLIVAAKELPPSLTITARTEEGEIMGLRWMNTCTVGVQFHPESVLTPHGRRLIQNFLEAPAVPC